MGLTYDLEGNQTFGAYAGVGHREPNRTDLQYATDANELQPERMLDLELNYRNSAEKWAFDVNAYRQQYQNQLVLTGEIDNQGMRFEKMWVRASARVWSLPVLISLPRCFQLRPMLH